MHKLDLKLQKPFEEMIVSKLNSRFIIPGTRYRVSHRSLVDKGLGFP